MEIYNTEEQQVEAIKRFWKQNGVSIIAGVVIGLAGLYGFRFYQAQQVASIQGQSSQYATLIEKIAAEGADKPAWLIEAQTFIEANPEFGRMLGYDCQSIDQMSFTSIIPPSQRQCIQLEFEQLLALLQEQPLHQHQLQTEQSLRQKELYRLHL